MPKDRQGNDLAFTFQGAGLVLYQDKDNFVRLERTAGVAVENLTSIHKVLFEVVKDGKHVNNQVYVRCPKGTVYLFLMRRKGKRAVCVQPESAVNRLLRFKSSSSICHEGQGRAVRRQYLGQAVHGEFRDFALFNDVTRSTPCSAKPRRPRKRRMTRM